MAWAVVQTGEAEVAVSLFPDGMIVGNSDESVGANLGTFATTNAVGGGVEVLGGLATIKGEHCRGVESAETTMFVEPAMCTSLNLANDVRYLLLGSFENGLVFSVVGAVEQRYIGVWHQHRVFGIEVLPKSFLHNAGGVSGGSSAVEHEVRIVLSVDFQRG